MRARRQPEITEVLRYFDASVAARHLRIPTLVAAAQFDPAVPPPGQFAVFNALPGPKELVVMEAGHFDWPGLVDEELNVRSVTKKFFDRV